MNAQVYIERTDYCGHDAPIVSLCVGACDMQDRGEGVFIPEEDVADDDQQVLYLKT